MKYNKGDRVLYNRQKFGTVKFDHHFDDHSEIAVVFDREEGKIVLVRTDMLELVSDPQHEARLAALINSPVKSEYTIAGELRKLSEELSHACATEKNPLKLRTVMTSVSLRLRSIAEDV